FANIVENTFTLMMLGLVFYFGIVFCLHGFLLLSCEGLYRTMCDLEWYKLEPKKARTLILLLIRTSQPFRITAGKIFPLTMTTFCSLLKTSAGYISFLLANQG
ncbi:odorant receptor 43a-like, partial [Pogonomyrmex barbatus]|uniref:Odorant receptor 43a-like n=1 Tax=Pogonomyrmex barbatus TaxID=144034 RepID=A0A8N1S8S5_9HYME